MITQLVATPPTEQTPPAGPYQYITGHPRQYQFDTAKGWFTCADRPACSLLTIQPIAWRLYTDQGQSRPSQNWAELFFIDYTNSVSVIRFHSYSLDNLHRMLERLWYDDLTLADAQITIQSKWYDAYPNPATHVATFDFILADPQGTKELQHYAQSQRIYCAGTVSGTAVVRTQSNYNQSVHP